MSPTSAGGGYRFDFQAVSISPASLKRRCGKEIFLQSKNFLLNRGVIKGRRLIFRPRLFYGILSVGAIIDRPRNISTIVLEMLTISAIIYRDRWVLINVKNRFFGPKGHLFI